MKTLILAMTMMILAAAAPAVSAQAKAVQLTFVDATTSYESSGRMAFEGLPRLGSEVIASPVYSNTVFPGSETWTLTACSVGDATFSAGNDVDCLSAGGVQTTMLVDVGGSLIGTFVSMASLPQPPVGGAVESCIQAEVFDPGILAFVPVMDEDWFEYVRNTDIPHNMPALMAEGAPPNWSTAASVGGPCFN